MRLSFEERIQAIPKLAAACACLATLALFVIWVFFPQLKEFSSVTMKANTTVGIFLLGLSLFCLADEASSSHPHRRAAGRLLAALALILASATASQYLLGLNLGIDEFISRDFPNSESLLFPGRMSPIAAFCLFLLALSYLILDLRVTRRLRLSEGLLVTVFAISSISLVGYLYRQPHLYQIGPFIRISWESAACYFILSLGGLISRPGEGLARILTSRGLGGITARRMLPIAILMPLLLGGAWLMARRHELIGRELGVSLFVVLVIAIFMALVTFTAKRIDRLQSEGAARLAESEEIFQTLANSLPQVAWMADADGWIFWYNERWYEYTGTTLEQMKGWGWQAVHHPQHERRVTQRWKEFLASGQEWEDNFPLRGQDGQFRWFLSRARPIRNAEGKIVRWFGTNTDVTEQMQVRELVEAERRKFEAVFVDSPAAMALLQGPRHVFEKANRVYLDMVPDRQVIGRPFSEVFPELSNQGFFGLLDRVFETGETYTGKESLVGYARHKPGLIEDSYFDFTYSRVLDGQGRPYGVYVHAMEVTDRVRDRKRLESLSQELQLAVRARDSFLSIASHELKTPLTSLKLQAQIFQLKARRADPYIYEKDRIDTMANQTDKQVSRLTRLVDDMLDISRIRTGRLTIERERFDLRDLVREVLERLRSQFDLGASSFPELEDCDPQPVNWDRLRIEQVLNNLFTNAIRYGKGNPIRVRIESRGGNVRLTISDQGIGVAPENRETIFERFVRGVDPSEVSGLGLGLFIARQIVVAHGGRIWVESELGHGSTFIVELPREKADDQAVELVDFL